MRRKDAENEYAEKEQLQKNAEERKAIEAIGSMVFTSDREAFIKGWLARQGYITELETQLQALRDEKKALKRTINKDTETIAKQAMTIHKLMHRGTTG